MPLSLCFVIWLLSLVCEIVVNINIMWIINLTLYLKGPVISGILMTETSKNFIYWMLQLLWKSTKKLDGTQENEVFVFHLLLRYTLQLCVLNYKIWLTQLKDIARVFASVAGRSVLKIAQSQGLEEHAAFAAASWAIRETSHKIFEHLLLNPVNGKRALVKVISLFFFSHFVH